MQIGVIGCGRWGAFIAWYLNDIGHSVSLYGRENSARFLELSATRTNGLLHLPARVALTSDLDSLLQADIVIISIDSQGLRNLVGEIAQKQPKNKVFVLCMKGIEQISMMRLSQIAKAALGEKNDIAVWLGPGHVQEFIARVPNCMVIDSENDAVKTMLVEQFSSELIRFYYGQDLLGNEIGAAAKNVIGIAAGLLDGLNLSTLKGALMARGTREISRLIAAMGGNALSAYGLCHLGDYGATVFSPYSNNRRFGELFARGERYDKLAEGAHTVRALVALSERYDVELPICAAVHAILYEGVFARTALDRLFSRSIKGEIES